MGVRDLINSRWRRFRRKFLSFRLPSFLTLDFYFKIVSWPFRSFILAWRQGRLRNLLLGIPALIAISVAVYFAGAAQSQSVSSSYWQQAQSALAAKEYPKLELLLDRILKEQDGHEGDARFALAMMYDDLGMTDRAAALFSVLAPDNRQGYPEAHCRLAILLSANTTQQSSKEELKRLHWHLTAGRNDSSAGMSLAWGRYSWAVQDFQNANKYFRQAADEYPGVWKAIGDIEAAFGNADAARTGHEMARQYLSEELRKRPENFLARHEYADVLVRFSNLTEAQNVLEQGLRFSPEQEESFRYKLAELYTLYHDLAAGDTSARIGDLLQPLGTALDYDPNFIPALNRLMSYAKTKVEGNIELRTILTQTVAEGKKPALAHLALGNLCWLEGDTDQAVFHFERARKIDSKLAVVMNNLAWMVAHDEDEPDLDKALALINEALEVAPDNPRFQDTRGTIRFLKKDWEGALDDLEKAIHGIPKKSSVHQKLARIYDELNMKEIAEQHRLLATEEQNQEP